jgi:hypothetical protein
MSDSPSTSRTRRRPTAPPPNTKRTLPPRKAAKRKVPTPDVSEEACEESDDDGYEYISIVDSESEGSDLDPEQPAKALPKGPVRRLKTIPDDGLTPRQRAKRRYYYGCVI